MYLNPNYSHCRVHIRVVSRHLCVAWLYAFGADLLLAFRCNFVFCKYMTLAYPHPSSATNNYNNSNLPFLLLKKVLDSDPGPPVPSFKESPG